MDREVPWYPSMRLYQQEQPGDWAPVLERIKSDLGNIFSSELKTHKDSTLSEKRQSKVTSMKI